MPYWSISAAMPLVRPSTPPLAAPYTPVIGTMPNAEPDVTLTIRPYPWSRMCGSAARHIQIAPYRLAVICSSISASLISSKLAKKHTPALLTRMSIDPNASNAVCTAARAPSGEETELVSATASPPSALISSATECASALSEHPRPPDTVTPMSFTTTLAP
jgi:hypothetical protein